MSQTAPVANAPAGSAVRLFARAYRVELTLFAVSFLVLAAFSAQRFWRQSEAPHFVYQAKAWLEGRADIDAQVLPNIEDWACVREVAGQRVRCEGRPQAGDKWFSSFPWFPSVVMLPFVAVNGYQLNDTSFGVIVAALAIALFYSLLRLIKDTEGTQTSQMDDALTALLLGFGTLFFYASIRGEVWFSAEIMGVAFTALYLRNAVQARRPLLAGLFWSMAVLTRTPLLFTGVFFVFELVAGSKAERAAISDAWFALLKKRWREALGAAIVLAAIIFAWNGHLPIQSRLVRVLVGEALLPLTGVLVIVSARMTRAQRTSLANFVAGAAPIGVIAAVYNYTRFGSFTEFGHRFFFNNRVNQDIDTYGLFHLHYLARNLDAAFLKLPVFAKGQLSYSPWGMSLFITLPLLAICFVPSTAPKKAIQLAASMLAVLVVSAAFSGPMTPFRWVLFAVLVGVSLYWAREIVFSRNTLRGVIRSVPALLSGGLVFGSSSGDEHNALVWTTLIIVGIFFTHSALEWATSKDAPRLLVPVLVTLVACMVPGLLYQNTGYAQFGFRFSIDYTPYLMLLIPLAGWSWKKPIPMVLALLSVLANFWGAVGFRGFTEQLRHW